MLHTRGVRSCGNKRRMQPWRIVGSIETPEGVLELRQRGERSFLITIAGRVLMTSDAHRSEDALAKLACAPLAGRTRPRVLLGGLGMGYTLRAALDALPGAAEIRVVDLNPIVVDWCRGPLADLTGKAIDDPRVEVVVADVAEVIGAAPPASLDAIVLDLYEGPNEATSGESVLSTRGRAARACERARPDGVWASGRDRIRPSSADSPPPDSAPNPSRRQGRPRPHHLLGTRRGSREKPAGGGATGDRDEACLPDAARTPGGRLDRSEWVGDAESGQGSWSFHGGLVAGLARLAHCARPASASRCQGRCRASCRASRCRASRAPPTASSSTCPPWPFTVRQQGAFLSTDNDYLGRSERGSVESWRPPSTSRPR